MPFSLVRTREHPFFACHPVYLVLGAYGAGLTAGRYEAVPAASAWGALVVLLVLGTGALLMHRPRASQVIFSLGIFLVGNITTQHYLAPLAPSHHLSRYVRTRPLTIQGRLYQPQEFVPDRTRLYVRARYLWMHGKRFPVMGNLLLTMGPGPQKFFVGDEVLFSARLRAPRNFGNPGGFDYAQWLSFHDLSLTGFLPDPKKICRLADDSGGWSLLRSVDVLRDRIRTVIDSQVPDPANLFVRAVILGEGKALPEAVAESFARSGTAHVIAISGLHVGIVAAASFLLFRLLLSFSETLLLYLNVPKLSAFLSLFPIFFYTLIAGAGVSVQRAFSIVVTYIAALLLNRERDLFHALALAALLILGYQPAALFGASFQLSFLAVLGILVLAPRLQALAPEQDPLLKNLEPVWRRKGRQQLVAFLSVTLAATVATAPVVAYHFSLLSLSGLAANLIIVPLAGAAVVCLGLVGVVFVPFLPAVAGFIFWMAGALSFLAIAAAEYFAGLPWAALLVPTPTLVEIALFYLLLGALLAWKRSAWAKAVAAALAVALITATLAWNSHLKPTGFRATFLDVGQGDAALLQFPQGATMLIDSGGSYDQRFDTGRQITGPYLLRQRIRHLDYLVLSHHHPDHFGGMKYLLKHFSIGEFWYNGDSIDDPYWQEIIALAREKQVKLRIVNVGFATRTIQGVEVSVLHPGPACGPPARSNAQVNNRSLVLSCSYGRIRYLFTGDIHVDVERSLAAKQGALSASVLKVPHHGSLTSSSAAFVKAVHPQIAVCSAGYHNPFNLPHPKTIARYREEGCTLWRTDLHGAIITTTDGNSLMLQCTSAPEAKR